jgi:hypothetical protein
MFYLIYRGVKEFLGAVHIEVVNAFREGFLGLLHYLIYLGKDLISVRTSCLEHSQASTVHTHNFGVGAVGERAKLYTGHILKPYYRTIGVCFKDNVFVLGIGVVLSFIFQYVLKRLSTALTETTRSGFYILLFDGIKYILGR